MREGPASVVISYARADGTTLATRLREDLKAAGLAVWMDVEAIEGGDVWSREIEQAIDRAQAVVALMSEGSFVSDICRAEHLRALRKRRRVVPLLIQSGADRPLYFEHLHYLDFSNPGAYPDRLTSLIREIASPEPVRAVPDRLLRTRITVPPVPLTVVTRVREHAAIRALLLAHTGSASVAGIRGMGGTGKTVMAQALCHDPLVQAAFPDGIAWVALGRQAGDLTAHLRSAGVALGDDPAYYATLEDAIGRLRAFMNDKAALVVLDDVWDARDVEAFRVSARRCRLLFTTRDAQIAAGLGAPEYVLGSLATEEARTVLARWAAMDPSSLPPEADTLIDLAGALPLSLAMAGAMVRGKPHRWSIVCETLRSADLAKIAYLLPSYPHRDLLRVLQVSVDELPPALARRYLDLAVFPADRTFPETAAATVWRTDPSQTTDNVDALVDRSLAARDERGWISLHALQHDYVQHCCTDQELAALHQRLVDGYRNPQTGALAGVVDDGYAFQRVPYHLRAGGLAAEWRALLFDFSWLTAKMAATDVVAVLEDFTEVDADPALTEIRRALILSAHVLTRNKTQLASQLYGRLFDSDTHDTRALLDRIRAFRAWPWLRPLTGALASATGPLLQTLLGHLDRLTSVAISSDGRIAVSASVDGACHVWDLRSGALRRSLPAEETVKTLVILRDDAHVVCGTRKGEIEVWNLDRCDRIANVRAPAAVTGLAATPDGFVSSSTDGTVRLWRLGADHTLTDIVVSTFPEDYSATQLAVHPDGRRVLAAGYPGSYGVGPLREALRLIDLETKTIVRSLQHRDPMRLANGIAFDADGALAVTVSGDGLIIVWNLASGEQQLTIQVPNYRELNGVAVSPDGRTLVTADGNGLLSFWSLETGAAIGVIQAHTSYINSLAVSADGRHAITGSGDHTARVWDIGRTPSADSSEPAGVVAGLVCSPAQRRVYSGAADGKLRTWSLDTCREIDSFQAHAEWILSLAVTPDGRWALTGSADGTGILWDLQTRAAHAMLPHPGRALKNIVDDTTFVEPVVLSADATVAVTGFQAERSIVRVSDLSRPGPFFLRPSVRHEWRVDAADICLLPGDRQALIATEKDGCTIWDLASGEMVRTVTGAGAIAAVVSSDGSTLATAGREPRVDIHAIDTGRHLAAFDVPGPVSALAISLDGRLMVAGFGAVLRGWRTGLGGGGVALFDLATRRQLAACSTEAAVRRALVVDRDGTPTVVAGDETGRVYFFELVTPATSNSSP